MVALALLGVGAPASAAVLSAPVMGLSALVLLLATVLTRDWPLASSSVLWMMGTCFACALGLSIVRRSGLPRLRSTPAHGILAGFHAGMSRERQCASVGVNTKEVLASARECFLRLQAAWDEGDVDGMRQHATGGIVEDLLQELLARDAGCNQTEFLTLHVSLLLMDQRANEDVASVEFSGLVRESPDRPAVAFDEIWMMIRPKGSSPERWRLARQQTLL